MVVSQALPVVQDLTKSPQAPKGGQAYLSLEGQEQEPFLQGAKFEAMPPAKRFRQMDELSGGEKVRWSDEGCART